MTKTRKSPVEELLNDVLAEFDIELDALGEQMAAKYRQRCNETCVDLWNDGFMAGKEEARYAPWP